VADLFSGEGGKLIQLVTAYDSGSRLTSHSGEWNAFEMNKTLRMEAKDILLSHAEKDWCKAIEIAAAKVVLNSNERVKLDGEMAKLKKRPWNHASSSNWIGKEPGNREETFGEQRRLLAAERGKLMLLKQGVVDMDLQYYDGVRQTIGNLDSLVVEILAKGATLVIAILVTPFSLVHLTGGASGSPIPMRVFWVSLAAIPATAYVIFAVSLYSDLLKRAVHLGTQLDRDLFEKP
jgi:hypothetical protein